MNLEAEAAVCRGISRSVHWGFRCSLGARPEKGLPLDEGDDARKVQVRGTVSCAGSLWATFGGLGSPLVTVRRPFIGQEHR